MLDRARHKDLAFFACHEELDDRRGCNIGQNVVISPDVTIGNNVKIQNNVSVYTGCILEDDVFCGPSMVFTNVMNPRSHVTRKDEYKTTLVRQGRRSAPTARWFAERRSAGTRLWARVRW